MSDVERRWIADQRQRELGQRSGLSPVVSGARACYRPGELVLHRAAVDQVAEVLAHRYGGRRFTGDDPDHWRNTVGIPTERGDLNGRLSPLDHALWTVPETPDTTNLPELVSELRDLLPAGHDPTRVSLNHVCFGEPLYQGGPGGEPAPIGPVALPDASGHPGGAPDLAVLDTGLPGDWSTLHPPLSARLVPDLDNLNKLYQDGSTTLASEAGHGLFICGLVARLAPDLVVDPGRVLDPTGVGDDVSIAAELLAATAPVINLSLGGYTDDDAPPPALAAALAAKGRDVAVVAAAGNNASDRPFWPAALKGVIAVGGYDSTAGTAQRTDFSNAGAWVDVCAPAVGLASTYVNGVWPAHDGARTFAGWARWSGTSFAAPLVAAEIARRVAASTGQLTGRRAGQQLLSELADSPWAELGALYRPPADLTH